MKLDPVRLRRRRHDVRFHHDVERGSQGQCRHQPDASYPPRNAQPGDHRERDERRQQRDDEPCSIVVRRGERKISLADDEGGHDRVAPRRSARPAAHDTRLAPPSRPIHQAARGGKQKRGQKNSREREVERAVHRPDELVCPIPHRERWEPSVASRALGAVAEAHEVFGDRAPARRVPLEARAGQGDEAKREIGNPPAARTVDNQHPAGRQKKRREERDHHRPRQQRQPERDAPTNRPTTTPKSV